MVDHTRDHPAVQGYFLIQELPADAPFMNWMSGYGERERIVISRSDGKEISRSCRTGQALGKRG